MKLYGAGGTRWVRPYWTLKELGIDFEPVSVNLREGEHLRPEFRAVNPFGKVPVLVDGDLVLTESAAICVYLADKVPERGLAPPAGTPERAVMNRWLFYCMTELEQPLWRIAKHTFIYPKEKRSPAEIELAGEDFQRAAEVIEQTLPASGFLVGARFTVADIVAVYTLVWARKRVDPFPALSAYRDAHTARPAFPAHLFQT